MQVMFKEKVKSFDEGLVGIIKKQSQQLYQKGLLVNILRKYKTNLIH